MINYKYNNYRFGLLKKEHLSSLKDWRNAQVDVLRQVKILSDFDQQKWWRIIKRDKTQSLFAITENKKFIGYCGLTNIDFRHKRAEVSFLVNPIRAKNKAVYEKDFWAVLYILCSHGFKKLGLNKIFTDTFEFRENHIKIIEKFGFKKEAKLRNHYFKRGKFYNSIIHSILREEAIGWLPKTWTKNIISKSRKER